MPAFFCLFLDNAAVITLMKFLNNPEMQNMFLNICHANADRPGLAKSVLIEYSLTVAQ